MNLVNCDNLEVVENRLYGGATGAKIAVKYNDSVWMVKCCESLRDKNYHNVEISYANDVISEYIGSRIYQNLGLPTQRVVLGTLGGRICIMCSDDAYPEKLTEFREFRNSMMDLSITQPSSGMSAELRDIEQVIVNHKSIDTESALQRFWTMFVFDTLIGNVDRNNGNWGFVYKDGKYQLYEVYDCGGCLNCKRSDNQMEADYKDDEKMNNLALNFTFNYTVNGKRINPFHYIEKNLDNKYILEALDKISMIYSDVLFGVLDELDGIISNIRKAWYAKILSIRLVKLRSYSQSVPSHKIEWCRRNAPTLIKDLPDMELWSRMKDLYDASHEG